MSAKRALIVDDSRSARTFLTRILERYDLQVDGAASAEEAIEYLIRQRPDVIFLDHLMPGMDGFQALTAIKNDPRTATIPVMMYTSQEGELYLSQARALGAMGVLPKQTRPADVSRALEQLRLLGERRPESEIATVRVPSLRDVDMPAAAAAAAAAGDAAATAGVAAAGAGGASAAPMSAAPPVEAEPADVDSILRRPLLVPPPGLTPEMRAQLELMLRDHATELRRFVARSLAQQSGQIIKELRTLLDGGAEGAVPVPAESMPTARQGVAAAWLGAVAAFIAVLGGLLWYRAGDRSGADRGAAHPPGPAARAPTPEAGAGEASTGASATAATAMHRGAAGAGAVPAAPLLVASVPFGASPFSGERIDAVQAVLARLVATGFRGVVEIRSFPGRYCLQGTGDGVALPPPELSYSKCDQIGNPVDYAGVAGRESVAFANMLSAQQSRSHGALEVQLAAGGADEVLTPYPTVTTFLTTGEWNRAAAANNRVEVRTRPQT